ncbi:MAG: restriction endonuclease [Sphingorhabdus sp.]
MAAAYDFQSLSPLDFEELVRDLLQAEWGKRLESFGPGRDQGIDLRYLNGPDNIIVQAKHYSRSGFSKLLSSLKSERDKAIILKPTRYILATSVSLTSERKAKILKALVGVPVEATDVIGAEELNGLILAHPEIEKRNFKLWLGSTSVLERILHSGVYNRTAAEMDVIKEAVPRFVQNASVEHAEKLLAETGALIIAGPPGVGKTTLARILLWLHAEQGWQVYVVDSLDDAFTVAESSEKRLILLDDFLGQVRLSSDHVRGIDSRLPPMLARVASHEGLRFILTTRDYILAQARALSARLQSAKPNAREYVLNVGSYTREVRAQILYNHIYFSGLTADQIDSLLADDFYISIIDHPNFNPRIIEEITKQDFLTSIDGSIQTALTQILANPSMLWDRPYRQHTSEHGQAMMIALFLHGRSAQVDTLKASYWRVSAALGVPIHASSFEGSFKQTFAELDGSVLGLNTNTVSFTNPGLRDYLQRVVVGDGLIPVLIPHLATIHELGELWAVFSALKDNSMEGASETAWLSALDRCDCDRYKRLEFLIDFYRLFDNENLVDLIDGAIGLFENDPLGSDEVSEACAILEASWWATLPYDTQEKLQNTLTISVAKLLEEESWCLAIDDIKSLDSALHEYGNNQSVATLASHVAMDSIEKNISDETRHIETLDDLDEFEDDLIKFFHQRGYDTSYLSRRIQDRREQLYEEPQRPEPEYEGRGHVPFRRGIEVSNEHIRSIFRGLRS